MRTNVNSAPRGALAKKLLLAGVSALAATVSAAPAAAAGTPAGTIINNVATATYETPGGVEDEVTSNTVTLTVDELLDVAVASADPGDVATTPGATGQVLRFTITNAGNGSEAFRLTARGNDGSDDFDPAITSIVIDSNDNGAYDAGIDTAYVADSNDPVLAPDTSLAVFILSSIPADAADGARGRADLAAAARTGSGTPGTSFAGAGQGGGNAVVGATGADAEDDGTYLVSRATVSFVKSASVADAFGGVTKVPGSTITYTLAATISGSGSLANVRVVDSIPAGTSYKPGSLSLGGAALTDAADGDAGNFTGSGIAVALGNVAAGSSRTITFQVKID